MTHHHDTPADNNRAALDDCTNQPTCPSSLHLASCPGPHDQADEVRVPRFGIPMRVTTEEAERLEAEAHPEPSNAAPVPIDDNLSRGYDLLGAPKLAAAHRARLTSDQPEQRPPHHQDPTTATYCVADGCRWDTRGTAHGAGPAACLGRPVDPEQPCLLRSTSAAHDDGESYRRHHPRASYVGNHAPTPKPWAESVQPTAEELHHWLADNRDQPAARGLLAGLMTAAERGTRCLELGHDADLAYLSTVLDELAAARRRIHRLEHTHRADLAETPEETAERLYTPPRRVGEWPADAADLPEEPSPRRVGDLPDTLDQE